MPCTAPPCTPEPHPSLAHGHLAVAHTRTETDQQAAGHSHMMMAGDAQGIPPTGAGRQAVQGGHLSRGQAPKARPGRRCGGSCQRSM